MTHTFIHSAQFWTWLLEWASQGTIPVMFFLCSKPAHSSCGLWIGPKLSLFLPSRHCSIFQHPSSLPRFVLYHRQAAPGSSLFWEGAPVCLAPYTACHDVSFSWNEWSNYTNHNHPLKPIKILPFPRLIFDRDFTFLSHIPCSIGLLPCQQHSRQLPVSELCVWCFQRAEAVSLYCRVLMGTWRSMSHASVNV